MTQCRACASYNDPNASFCGQCGEPLGGAPRRGSRGRRTLLLCLTTVLLAGGAWWGVERWLRSGGGASARDPRAHTALVRRPPARDRDVADASPGQAEEIQEPRPLPALELARLAEGALATLVLLDGEGERLRDQRAVLLGDGRRVLSRFRPILGASSAVLRAGPLAGPEGWEVLGLVAWDPYRDLAVLEVKAPVEVRGLVPRAGGDPGLEAGMEVAVAGAAGGAILTSIERFPHFTPDGSTHALLAAEPALPAHALFALDLFGALVGLCAPEVEPSDEEAPAARSRDSARGSDAAVRLLLDPLGDLPASLALPARLTLAEATRRFHEGTYADLREQARRAAEQGQAARAAALLAQALDQAEREGIPPQAVQETLELLRRTLDDELARRAARKDFRGAVGLLELATARFPEERRYWTELGAAFLGLEEHHQAVNALLEAQRLEPGSDVETLLQETYLSASRREISLGRLPLAAEWLESAVGVLPGSARLQMELGKLYARMGAYDGSVRAYQAARALDPGLAPEVESALERIEDVLRRREAVVLEIPPGASSIQGEVVLNGVASYRFVIDTGATYTSISQEMADALGYQVTPSTERVLVGTANGATLAPVLILGSVSLQGFTVRNVKALVLPNKSQSQVGLLGLNFLDHFRYSVDPGRREFRLERR